MARFFANVLPEIALIWSLSLALFYRRIYVDMFEAYGENGEKKIVPQWITLALVCVFILLPVRTWINKCFSDQNAQTAKTYDEVFTNFASDYD